MSSLPAPFEGKVCTRCERLLPIGEFYPGRGRDNRKAECRHCSAARERKRHKDTQARLGQHVALAEAERIKRNQELYPEGLRWCPVCTKAKTIDAFDGVRASHGKPGAAASKCCIACMGGDEKRRLRLKRNKRLAKEGLRECNRCARVLPVEAFGPVRQGKYENRQATCKECFRKTSPKRGPYKKSPASGSP